MELGTIFITVVCVTSLVGMISTLISIFYEKDTEILEPQIIKPIKYINEDSKYEQYKTYGIILDEE